MVIFHGYKKIAGFLVLPCFQHRARLFCAQVIVGLLARSLGRAFHLLLTSSVIRRRRNQRS